ncbi:acyltransferase family protein [Brevundimonas sp. VNH65]|uniref:acyltransferase family protein n=1 Tax=Brevundimonas sp. VNH65 TaxID=3400917 RepID=UPI003C07926A
MKPTLDTPPRLLSLDVLRGLTVIGMIVVNASAGLQYGGQFEVYPQLLHSRWIGVTLADLVFPAFLMIVGVSIPLAVGADAAPPKSHQVRAAAGRTARLFLLGLILSNLFWFQTLAEPGWRFWGVLQRIGLVYAACVLLFLYTGPKARLAVAMSIPVLYWPLSLLPPLDGGATDLGRSGVNFIASIDRLTLGDHNYVKGPSGYDPEGLIGTFPAIAHGLIGVLIGEFLLKRRGPRAAGQLAAAGLAMLAAGLAWSLAFPVIKDIWSSSFVLVTCGLTTIILAILHGALDRPEPSRGALTLLTAVAVPFGINAIAAYILHALAGPMVGWRLLLAPAERMQPLIGDQTAALTPVLLFTAAIWLCMAYLRDRRWVVRI